MADIFDWSATAANNTTLDSINVNTGMSPGNVDNAIRSLMALVRNTFVSSWEGLFAGTTSGIPVSNGAGTISTKAAPTGDIVGTSDTQTLTNKTLGSGCSLSGITDLAVADGGTGASTAANAFANIAVTSSALTANGYIKFANGLYVFWGTFTASANTSTSFTYSTISASLAPGTFSRVVVSGTGEQSATAQDNGVDVLSCSTTGFSVWNASNSCTAFFIGVGV